MRLFQMTYWMPSRRALAWRLPYLSVANSQFDEVLDLPAVRGPGGVQAAPVPGATLLVLRPTAGRAGPHDAEAAGARVGAQHPSRQVDDARAGPRRALDLRLRSARAARSPGGYDERARVGAADAGWTVVRTPANTSSSAISSRAEDRRCDLGVTDWARLLEGLGVADRAGGDRVSAWRSPPSDGLLRPSGRSHDPKCIGPGADAAGPPPKAKDQSPERSTKNGPNGWREVLAQARRPGYRSTTSCE